jgi:biopolymer transport protein ExbD/biopolymer transport protein TolR
MLKYGGRRRRSLPVAAEINITNLVDVAFVLLIIFMITAPILQGGIEVQLATAEAQPLEQSDPVTVSIAQNGDVFVEKARVASLDELETVLRTFGDGEGTQVALKPDQGADWRLVARVLGRLRKLEIVEVGFVVEPERER